MKIVGKRKIRELSLHASAEQLVAGCAFNDEIHKLPSGKETGFPKGVYRYKSQEEANAHWDEALILGIVRAVKKYGR
ncbi:MAG: hypothetical protein AABY83_11050 [Pseudomonadota bacterium]